MTFLLQFIVILMLSATSIESVLIEVDCPSFPSTKNQYFIYKLEQKQILLPYLYIPFNDNFNESLSYQINNCLQFHWKFKNNNEPIVTNCSTSIEFENFDGEMLINDETLFVSSGAVTFNHSTKGLLGEMSPDEQTFIQIIKKEEFRLIYSCKQLNASQADQSFLILRPSNFQVNQESLEFLWDSSSVFQQLNQTLNLVRLDKSMECEGDCLRFEKIFEVIGYPDAGSNKHSTDSFMALIFVVSMNFLFEHV